jgi:hypothetical protein
MYGAELDDGPNGSDTTPLPKENIVMTVYRAPTHWRRMSSLSPRAPTHCGWDTGAQGCNDTSFPSS